MGLIPGINSKLTLLLKLELQVNVSNTDFYRWFSDLNNYPLIFPHVYEIKPISEKLVKPGNQYIEYAKNFYGRKEKLKIKILKVVENEEMWAEVDNARVESIFCFTFKENGKKSLFTIQLFSKHQNSFKLLLFKIGLSVLFFPRRIIAQKRLRKLFPTG